jgi:hypothetical protein
MGTSEENDNGSEYVTKDDLRSILSEMLGGGGGDTDGDDDDDDGWEVIDDAIEDGWEVIEELGETISDAFSGDDDDDRVSSSDIERIAEQKVQEALRRLAGTKKATPAKKAAPKREKKEPEVEPTTKKTSWSSRLWGEQ